MMGLVSGLDGPDAIALGVVIPLIIVVAGIIANQAENVLAWTLTAIVILVAIFFGILTDIHIANLYHISQNDDAAGWAVVQAILVIIGGALWVSSVVDN